MISELFHRRRAERFARLLDQIDGGPRGHSLRTARADRLANELAIAQRLASLRFAPQVEPIEEFRADLRASLVATAERSAVAPAKRRSIAGRIYAEASPGRIYAEASPGRIYAEASPGRTYAEASPGSVASHARTGAAASRAVGAVGNEPTKPRLPGTRRTRAAVLVGVAGGALALSSMSVASGDAMPGDPLYGVKRSTEGAALALAGSDIDRGQAYLSFARIRAREAVATRDDPGRLGTVLTELDQQTRAGVRLLTSAALSHRDAGLLDPVDTFVGDQRPVLTDLLGTVSQRDRSRTQQSLDLLAQIAGRSATLRAAISCAPISLSDDLGPLPPDCTGH